MTAESTKETRHVEELLVTEKEAATALACSPGTLKAARNHRLKSNPLRSLPYVQIGRSIRYRKADINAWIEQHIVQFEEANQ